eukprot:scaffold264491_cov16-Prasinocladus_malaysianus.AAC.1
METHKAMGPGHCFDTLKVSGTSNSLCGMDSVSEKSASSTGPPTAASFAPALPVEVSSAGPVGAAAGDLGNTLVTAGQSVV